MKEMIDSDRERQTEREKVREGLFVSLELHCIYIESYIYNFIEISELIREGNFKFIHIHSLSFSIHKFNYLLKFQIIQK